MSITGASTAADCRRKSCAIRCCRSAANSIRHPADRTRLHHAPVTCLRSTIHSWPISKSSRSNKRSVYLLQQRFRPNPYLDLFDGADANSATPARVNNNTALQALYMMNNSFVEAQCVALAARVAVAEETAAARIRLAYRLLYGRVPTAAEAQMATQFLQQYRASGSSVDMAADERSRSSWTGLMRVLLSSNEFFYVD